MINQLHKNSSYPCSECGKIYPIDDMIEFNKLLFCFKCRPIFLQKIQEGVAIAPEKSRSKWWKIYFFIFLALQLMSFIISFQDIFAGEDLIASILDIIIGPVVLVAIFGYSFNKKILVRRIWKVLFPVAIISDIIAFYIAFKVLNNPEEIIAMVVVFIIFLPLIIFQYIALYRYGFSKTEPWT